MYKIHVAHNGSFNAPVGPWSILSTFYEKIFCTKMVPAAFYYLHVTREKLPKRLSYEKGTRKMLMKLILGELGHTIGNFVQIKCHKAGLGCIYGRYIEYHSMCLM